MKIATFNINNVNKRLTNLLAWLKATKPDVICLQKLKASDREFPQDTLAKAGYSAVWRGQKSWNGVAILARGRDPIVTRRDLPGGDDVQARYIEPSSGFCRPAHKYCPQSPWFRSRVEPPKPYASVTCSYPRPTSYSKKVACWWS